ncbi:MAG: hypothetical protein EBT84_12830, partial [Sphingomonadaceae bacterium]|nr:hypothetical protein [Sphingomonadaceae bacterium]
MDDNGHGTRVAGVIAAAPNNGRSHVGVAWNVRLMALKATDAQGNPRNSAIVQCIDYAIKNGAKILNCSFETSHDPQLFQAFQRAQKSGLLVITSAGNFSSNIDNPQLAVFPAGYAGFTFNLDNILTVAALDRRDGLARYSNFGTNNVHLGAPGVEIASTSYLGDNSYDTATLDLTLLDGTSLAAAHVGTQVPCEWVEASHPSYTLYTSGTTGRPKGVQRDTGGYMVNLAASMKNIFMCNPGETYFSTSDIGWVVGHSYIIYGPLLHGMATIMYEGLPIRPDAGIWWSLVEKYKVTAMFSAPTAVRVLKKQDPAYLSRYDLGSLRALFLAGEPLDEPTAQWIADALKRPIIDNYWQT